MALHAINAGQPLTPAIRAAAAALGILVHDHLIVGRGRTLSFRQEGLL